MSNKFSSTIQAYDQYAHQFVQHFEKRLDTTDLDQFLSHLPTKSFILDAGCGSARDAAYFIQQGHQAVGIDLSEGLLAEAKQLHPEVPTQLMSLTELSFPDHMFDGIWCKAALLHLDRTEIPSVLTSFHRILKSNGRLFIQTKAGEGEGTQPTPFDPELSRYFTFFSQPELENLVKKAGFTIETSYLFNGHNRYQNSRDQDWVVVFAQKNELSHLTI